MEGRTIGHRSALCEACAEGVCIGFYRQPDADSTQVKKEQAKEETFDSDKDLFLTSEAKWLWCISEPKRLFLFQA